MAQNNRHDPIRKELILCPLPEEAVNARLRRVYAELPDALPVRRRMPLWVRRGLCTAACLLAAFGLLLGVNGVDPALAESLPALGSIFRAINDAGQRPAENRGYAKESLEAFGEEVAGEEGLVVEIPCKNPLDAPMTAALQEVYYDGSFLFAGVSLRLDADGDRLTERFGPGYDILLNGESQVRHEADGTLSSPRDYGSGFCDMSDSFLTRLAPGEYALQRAFRVPDHLQGAESLDVTLCFDGFEIPQDNGAFTLSFTAQKTDVPARQIDGAGVETNGVRLVSAVASPTVTCIVAEYQDSFINPACSAVFEDGIYIGGLGGTEQPLEDGWVRDTGVYAGLRQDEERRVVWSLFDKNGSQQTEAVFVLDFQEGCAWVGGPEDLKDPPSGDYACGAEAVKNLKEGYMVEKFHMEQSKPTLWIAGANLVREELTVQVWQDGTLADSADTQGLNGWDKATRYFEYGPPGGPFSVNEEALEEPFGEWLLILRDSYAKIDMTRPLTVKAYNSAGELVLDEEITLEMHGTE